MNLDGKDPAMDSEYDEIDELGIIVWNGHLTDYGEKVYCNTRTLAYDEIDRKWIYV